MELGFHSSWKWNDIFSKFPRGMEWNGPLLTSDVDLAIVLEGTR
jgi:hypothetical protein